jgi:hypothetical protein
VRAWLTPCSEEKQAQGRGRSWLVEAEPVGDRGRPRKDEPGQAQFTWHPLAVTSEVTIIQGETAYPREGHTYSNLWVIRLDAEGRCTEFTEWWMRHPQPDVPPVEPSNQP